MEKPTTDELLMLHDLLTRKRSDDEHTLTAEMTFNFILPLVEEALAYRVTSKDNCRYCGGTWVEGVCCPTELMLDQGVLLYPKG